VTDLNRNPNTASAKAFVEQLALSGLRDVCIAPGSRSTPLALAFAARGDIRLHLHLDERSAGFFALGLAMSTGRPVALVCTSGTAAANFHPAVIEAFYSHVPLLVLTADRPPELRESGANQTIDQVKMFGDHVLWSVDAPVPQADAPAVVERHLRTLAARAVATADSLVKGPVHINMPFRKPLEPDAQADETDLAVLQPAGVHTRFSRGRLLPVPEDVARFADVLGDCPRGVILCGPVTPRGDFQENISALAAKTGYPVLADPLSGLRFTSGAARGHVLGGYDWWLPSLPDDQLPDVILRFGAVPTSAALSGLLERARPRLDLLVREDGQWADDHHRLTDLWQVEPAAAALALAHAVEARTENGRPLWLSLPALESSAWQALDGELEGSPFFDGAAVSALLRQLPDESVLFAGNSLAVRHIEQYGRPGGASLTLFGNRGASGIDGNVSTALGIAAGLGRPVVALLGDITFYHDMNGLLALRRPGIRATFVVLNNDGGGIFHRLPVARHDPPFNDLFLTPHGLTFEHAAAQYGLAYACVEDGASLSAALRQAFDGDARGHVIEIRTQSRHDDAMYRRLKAEVEARLQGTTQAR
jgi:2-succinyl-5-enolpyruvyl-6-hydroxy-3-cyclohexene-1-carboxylate synthase